MSHEIREARGRATTRKHTHTHAQHEGAKGENEGSTRSLAHTHASEQGERRKDSRASRQSQSGSQSVVLRLST